ncbi:SsrA-binding protein [Bacteroidota bacterium]|nr:SsrA-binding protein [Bacteroidota bacterium]
MSIKTNIEVVNRRAQYEFHLLESFVAGIQLSGTEVKAIREGKGNLSDAFCYFRHDELFVKNLNISGYSRGNINNHEPLRVRKLLLTKRELRRLSVKLKERGLTIVPVRMFFSERGYCKLEIALAKGKKTHDKRDTIKQKEGKRELDRVMKERK